MSSPSFNHIDIQTHRFKIRIILLATIMALLLCSVCLRLFYLQVHRHQFYATLSKNNLLSMIKIKASRGLIFDRNGVVLAKNIPSYTLMIRPEKVAHLHTALRKLTKIFPISTRDIRKYLKYRSTYRPFELIPLKTKLTEAQVAQFYVNQPQLPGFTIQTSHMRAYPLGAFTSEILGYVSNINTKELKKNPKIYDAADDIGKTGIEKYYETALRGKSGFDAVEINAGGHIIQHLQQVSPHAGNSLYLTIDSALQVKAHQLLDHENGAIVAIDPRNGEVLALVSHPSFDPNVFAKGISQQDYNKLLNDPNHPLFNRATNGQFASGSTIKPFLAVMSLAHHIITPNSRVFDPGWYKLPKTTHIYHDWKRTGHGWVDVTQAITVSCDTFFYNLATLLGIHTLNDFLQPFGFGEKTGIDLPQEQPGLLPGPRWKEKTQHAPWYTGDTIESAIGQGFFLTTPLQLAHATALLAEHGKNTRTHLLLKQVDEANNLSANLVTAKEPIVLERPQSWSIVHKAMQRVIDSKEGSANFFGPHPGFSVAGKTGTAQIYGHTRYEDIIQTNIPKPLRNNHLFIAFAPVDHPKIVIAVVIEHSAMSDKIAGTLLNYYLEKRLKLEKHV